MENDYYLEKMPIFFVMLYGIESFLVLFNHLGIDSSSLNILFL